MLGIEAPKRGPESKEGVNLKLPNYKFLRYFQKSRLVCPLNYQISRHRDAVCGEFLNKATLIQIRTRPLGIGAGAVLPEKKSREVLESEGPKRPMAAACPAINR